MPIDHGETPLDAAANWTEVGRNAPRNQVARATQGHSSEESNQNGQAIGEIGHTITQDHTPRRNESLYLTRINFRVIPTRDLKTISVHQSICRILSAVKAADKNARLIATNEEGDEIELHGSTDLTGNTAANQETVNQFIEKPKINKSNQLTGLIVLRSDTNYKEIKKNQLTQKILNDNPRIFLTANYLDVVTPATVGFFINTTPRPDKQETFNNRLTQLINKHDTVTKTQVEYGPIWAPNHRVSVFKLLTAFEDGQGPPHDAPVQTWSLQ